MLHFHANCRVEKAIEEILDRVKKRRTANAADQEHLAYDNNNNHGSTAKTVQNRLSKLSENF